MGKKGKTKRTESTHQLEDQKTLANRRRLEKEKTAGITLIALVVTIVVLLILAGLTINMVFSENGIFNTATDSKTKSKLAEIEDSATVIYSSLVAQKYATGSNAPITTGDVVAELSKQAEQGGYTIEPIALSENAVTGIEVEEENITLALGEEKEIIVKFEGAEGGYAYYVVLEGSYYAIEVKGGKVTVSKKAEKVKWVNPYEDEETIAKMSDNNHVKLSAKSKKQEVQALESSHTEKDVSLVEATQKQDFVLPLACHYTITSEYGERFGPITQQNERHTGIDIAGEHHAKVLAVADGEVTWAGVQNGYGNCIEVKHIVNGETIYSFYAHLSEIKVQKGEKVVQGQTIALEGGDPVTDPNPGDTTGHHLHFEIRNKSGYGNDVNPSDYIPF